jgi:8-amino-7-oxononanoate synthase
LDIEKRIRKRLEQRRQDGNYRILPRTSYGNDFYSNDYLGFAKSQQIYERVSDLTAVASLADGKLNGSTGSRLLSGNNVYVEELEKELTRFFKSDSALVFNSGFNLNMGLLSNVATDGDVILLDQNIHASLKVGAKLSQAETYYFHHNNLEHLEKRLISLRKKKDGLFFVITEGLFSMDGDIPDLISMLELCEKYGAHLIVDEAHSAGIYGDYGEGLVAKYGLEKKVFCRVITFGKAFGSFGAALLGPNYLKECFINFCPSFIYTTSMPLNSVLTTTTALQYRKNSDQEIKTLLNNCQYFADQMDTNFIGPIFSFQFKSLEILKKCTEECKKENIKLLPIMSPTVQKGKERIRVCIHSFNTKEEMDKIINILRSYK